MKPSVFKLDLSHSASGRCLKHKRAKGPYCEDHSNAPEKAYLKDLEIACLEHRELLFELGEAHQIKLHYGACLSMVEILAVIYLYWADISPENISSPMRDRFILSKGHGAPSLYLMLMQAGLVQESAFSRYRSMGSIFQGHPDRNKIKAIDCSTGSLGQGLGVATGIAWGMRHAARKHYTYCLLSDGECNEGSVWEAAMIAANAGLGNLVAIVDWNKKSSYGVMSGRNDVEPLADKWHSFNWDVHVVDGHSLVALIQALKTIRKGSGDRPSVILANTTKGKGIPYAEKNFVRSSSFLESQDLSEARALLESMRREITE